MPEQMDLKQDHVFLFVGGDGIYRFDGRRATKILQCGKPVVYPRLEVEGGHVVYREYTDPPAGDSLAGLEERRRWALDGAV